MIIFRLSAKEEIDAAAFRKKHKKCDKFPCSGYEYSFVNSEVIIKCLACREAKNITDVESDSTYVESW